MERLGLTPFCRNLFILLLAILYTTPAYAQSVRTSHSSGMNTLAAQKIDEYHAAGKEIDVVSFGPSGDWVLVADDYRYYSNLSHFDANGLRPKLEEYRSAGRNIDAIAQAPNGEWVIVAENRHAYSSVGYFESIGLRDQIGILLRDGIDDVEVGADGGWVVISNGRAFASGTLPVEMDKALRDSRVGKRRVQEVALDDERWFVSAGEWFQHGALSDAAAAELVDFREDGQRIDRVALAPGGWSIISNDLYTADDDTTGYSFENNLDQNSLNIYDRMDFHNVPGVSIAVTSNRGRIWARTYGLRASGTDHFVHADTRFPAASMSKAVGAAAVQRLVQAGRIDEAENVMDLEDRYPNTDFDHWVERIGEQDLARYIPAPALIKVVEFYQRGREIDVIALAPGNRWLVIADDLTANSEARYFELNSGLSFIIQDYIDEGKEIDAVSFTSTGKWVLVADDDVVYNDADYFGDIGLAGAINELLDVNEPIEAIALMSDAAWALAGRDSTRYSDDFDNGSLRSWIEAPLRYGIDEIIVTAGDAWKVFSNWMFEPEFTVHDLLGHTAGLSRHGIGLYPRGGALPFWQRPDDVPSLAEVLMGEGPVAGENVRLLAPPQTVWDYSGGGFSAAEALIEAITDKPFAEHADEDVLRALGMTKSTFQDLPISLAGEFAQGHRANLDPLPIRTCPGKMAGGLNTTASDYAKFVRMLIRGGLDEHDRPFLRSDLAEAMLASRKDDDGNFFLNANDPPKVQAYGLGVDVVDASGRFFHGGTQNGYKLQFTSCSNLSDSLGLVVLTNGKNNWTDAGGNTRGAEVLIAEVQQSFYRMCNSYSWPVASGSPGEAGRGSLGLRGRSVARATTSTSLNIAGDAVTVEAWVKHNGTSDEDAVIVSNRDGSGYGLRFEGSGEEVPVAFGVRLPFHSDSYVAFSDVGVPAGRWTHVAGTFDGTTLRVYVDGELSGTREQSGTIGSSEAPLAIGASTSGTEHILRGYVDEVRIWRTVRTSGEIAGDRFEVLDADEPGLAAYYRFGDRDPTADLSRNANDLRFIGPASHLLPDVFPTPPVVYAAPTADAPGSAIDIQWKGRSQDVMSYRLYRQVGLDAEGRELIHEIEAACVFSPCEYTDRDVAPGTPYAYFVTAVDPDGSEGDFSPLALTVPSTGKHAGLLRLRGEGHAEVSYRPTLDISGDMITVEAWIKHDGTSDEDAIIVSNQDGRGYGLRLEGSGEEVPVAFGAWLSIFTDSHTAISDVSVPAGRWTHVAGTHDGTTLRVYVDGKLRGTDDRNHDIGSSMAPLVIGANTGGTENHFHGDIDEVRIWSRTLSASELGELPSTTLLGNEEGLAALFRFDEGKGSVFHSSTARPMTGVLAGDAVLINMTPTSVASPGTGLPRTVQIDGNYPNPFAARTTIRYGLPEAASVRLTIYDLLGRRIAVLHDGPQAAGWHELVFEADRLSTGVYLYRLKVGGRTVHGRMLRIR